MIGLEVETFQGTLTSILHESEEFVEEYFPVWIIIYFIQLKY